MCWRTFFRLFKLVSLPSTEFAHKYIYDEYRSFLGQINMALCRIIYYIWQSKVWYCRTHDICSLIFKFIYKYLLIILKKSVPQIYVKLYWIFNLGYWKKMYLMCYLVNFCFQWTKLFKLFFFLEYPKVLNKL